MKQSSKRISVLLIEEGSSIITLRVIRCLGLTNQYQIHILSFSGKKIPSFKFSRYISSYNAQEPCDDEKTLGIILKTAGSVRADIVIPLMEKQTKIISRSLFLFREICLLPPLPDYHTHELVINKYLFAKWLFESGFSEIEPIHLGQLQEQNNYWNKITYPVLAKPFWGSSGEGIVRINDQSHLKQFLNAHPGSPDFLIQPYIPGSDIDLSALVENGKIIAYTIQRPFSVNRKFKYSKKIEFTNDSSLLKLSEKIFEKLDYSGIVHLDFRYNPAKNSYNLVDFNARYWSTITGSVIAGINFPHLACLIAQNKLTDHPHYDDIHFLSSENIFYILINSFRFGKKSLSFLVNNELYYGVRDPLPLVLNFVNLLIEKAKWYSRKWSKLLRINA
jgi:predicted ATP-grasp superfamily ATP-dependent carboligase